MLVDALLYRVCIVTPEAKLKQHLRAGFEGAFAEVPSVYAPLAASVFQKEGLPDICAMFERATLWVEAKANGNPLRPSQRILLPKMAEAGQAHVRVIECPDMDLHHSKRVLEVSVCNPTSREFELAYVVDWHVAKTRAFWRGLIK